jgi:uncharacterized phage protein (TIGR02220 family)
MAVRIDAEAFGDERFADLAQILGLADADHALGKMARIWRQCTVEQSYVLPENTINRIIGFPSGAEALIASRLAEKTKIGIRIRGTNGRIEWLGRLRENGKYGHLGGRPKAKPQGFEEPNPAAFPGETPLTLTLLTRSPPISPQKSETHLGFSNGKRGRPKKAKPGDPTDAELTSVRSVLAKLGERNGVRYAGAKAHVQLVVARLRDGYSEMDLRKVIAYCAVELGWASDANMGRYLRPETLFGPQTIARYVEPARSWFDSHQQPEEPTQ